MGESYPCFLLLTLILQSCCHQLVCCISMNETGRETLEISIGGGNAPTPSPPSANQNCPPPPPVPCPPPPPPVPCPPPPTSPFESERIGKAFQVIQDFKVRVTHDPHKVTDTWRGPDVCKYKGFACDEFPDDKKRAVAGIDFSGFDLGGSEFTFSGFLDRLDDLAIFHVNSNYFTGGVPDGIGTKLKYLYELDFSNNQLSGGFPPQVLGAKNLTFLDLRFNHYVGAIPPEVFDLPLYVLFLNNNHFTQSLPENLGSTPALYITFANNDLVGPIPRSIGRASETLLEILFLNNHFSGCLPYEIGLLKKARVLDLGGNRLTGQIPLSFQCLARMQLLNMAQNEFYGPVPDELCGLPGLLNLSLSFNYFTQVGPQCRKLIDRKVLDVRMNCILDLPNQKTGAQCTAFFSRPKHCPDDRSMQYVPCRNTRGSRTNPQETLHTASTAAEWSPRTYNALAPPPTR